MAVEQERESRAGRKRIKLFMLCKLLVLGQLFDPCDEHL
jgi:hypothetical protein